MNRFDDKRVLISGAGSGIGQATVARILAEGGTVVAADISETGLEQTLNTAKDAGHSDRLTTVKVDISSEESVSEQVGAAIKALGGLDVLVNAAGILRSAHTHEMTLDFWNTVIGVNLTGTFLMTRESLPALLESGAGVVVNFSSTSATFAHPYMTAYAASKWNPILHARTCSRVQQAGSSRRGRRTRQHRFGHDVRSRLPGRHRLHAARQAGPGNR